MKARGNVQEAIALYGEAVKSLQAMRQDLAVVNTAVQFSFQDSVEPVYRQLMALLLSADSTQAYANSNNIPNTDIGQLQSPSQSRLEQVRDLIESLQVAELDDFLNKLAWM